MGEMLSRLGVQTVLGLASALRRARCKLQKLVLARWLIPVGRLTDPAGTLSFGGANGAEEDVVLVSQLLHGEAADAVVTLSLSAIGSNVGPTGIVAVAAACSERRLRNLTFEDFLEAVVRVACVIALPTDRELVEAAVTP